MNFAGFSKKIDRKSAARVVDFVKQYLGLVGILLQSDQHVIATEIECNQPDCVPIETLVVLVGKNSKWSSKIMKPIIEVSMQDVQELDIPREWDTICDSDEVFRESRVLLEESIQAFISKLPNNERKIAEIIKLQDYLQTQMSSLSSSSSELSIATDSTTVDPTPITTTIVQMKPRADIVSTSKDCVSSVSISQGLDASRGVAVIPARTVAPYAASTGPSVASTGPSVASGPTMSVSNRNFRVNVIPSDKRASEATERHSKGTRQRGCPCCDPDNIDNIVDKLLYMDA